MGVGNCPARPVQHEQARGAALVGWKLRDELGRQIEREIRDLHRNGRRIV